MTQRAIWWGAAVLAMAAVPALARPNYLAAFKEHYGTASGKPKLNAANCAICHIGPPGQAKWNPYGQALRTALAATMVSDKAKIFAAMDTVAKLRAGGKTYADIIASDAMPGEAPAPVTTRGAVGGGGDGSGWINLFNFQNLDGWTNMNKGNWTVENDILKYTGGGNGWLRSNDRFTNFSLVMVWRYTTPNQANDSGLFLGAGLEGNPWPSGGVQINMGPGSNFGSVGRAPARGDLINRTPGEWNTFQVTVDHGVISMAINGKPAWDFAETPNIGGGGYVGIEAEGQAIEFQQIAIMPR